jgi:hypothetical protein
VSCGGSGGSGTTVTDNTGVFLDSAVAGLYYTSSPSGKSGRTDDFGQFNYTTGDTVEFKVGGTATGAVLGSVAAKSVIMPEDIADGATGTKSAKIAILLQSMDADGDADNGIDLGDTIIDSTMAATIKAILDSPLESGTHTFSANNIASFTAKTVASATAHLTTKASATAHIANTKKNKDRAKIANGKLKLTTTALTGENPGSSPAVNKKHTEIDSKTLDTSTTSVSIDASLDSLTPITGGTYTSSTSASARFIANFVNKNNSSDVFDIIVKLFENPSFTRMKLEVQCEIGSSCESGGTATSTIGYINSSTGVLSDSGTNAANINLGQMYSLSVAIGGNDGSSSHTFTINGKTRTASGETFANGGMGLSLADSAIYELHSVELLSSISNPDDGASTSASFDNFKAMAGTKTVHIDTFDKGLDNDIWDSITTKTE